MKTLTLLIIVGMLSSVAEDPSSIEAFIESLFDQKLFTIAFGAIVWFVTEWGVRRNNVTKLRNQMIKVSPEMKDMMLNSIGKIKLMKLS